MDDFRLLLMSASMQQKRLHSKHIIIIIIIRNIIIISIIMFILIIMFIFEAIANTIEVSGIFFIEGIMKHHEFDLHSQVPTSSGRRMSAVDRQRCGPLTSTTSFV